RSATPVRKCTLAALLGVSVGLNIFMAARDYGPGLVRELRLAIVPPPEPRPDDHVRGAASAKVTIIEYSDFQCPFSARLHPSLKRLGGSSRIRWIYRNFPLSSIHPRAEDAALAAECAGEQGRFWEYADALFDAQGAMNGAESSGAFLRQLAKQVGAE